MNSNRFRSGRLDREEQNAAKWARRRDVPIAILAWLVVGGLVIWAASYIVLSLLVMTVAALLAFALAPAVKLLQRVMPRVLAIIIVYLVVLTGISLLFYSVVNATVSQLSTLIASTRDLLTSPRQLASVTQFFTRFGITSTQLQSVGQVILQQATSIVGGTVPFLTSIADFILNIIIVAVLSIYLLLDGGRAVKWVRNNAPMGLREGLNFFLDTLERVIGGYIRGQLVMSALVGLLVGGGMAVFHVPYAVLLGVVAFILEFVPIIGTILSGVLCVLTALSQSLLIAVLVIIYFVVVHILEGDILAPRIVGRAVGVHPAVSLFALLAGAELFGIWGAVLGSPLAGLIQAVLVAVWQDWRAKHPEQFPDKAETEDAELDPEQVQDVTAEHTDHEEEEQEQGQQKGPLKKVIGIRTKKIPKPATATDEDKE